MKVVGLKELKQNTFFTHFLYMEGGFVLLAPETPVTPELIHRLSRWEFRELTTDGDMVESIPTEEGEEKGAAAEAVQAVEGLPEDSNLDAATTFYLQYIDYVESIYTRFVTNNELDFKDLLEKEKALYEVLLGNKRLMLRAQALAPVQKNYLVSHAVHTSILSIILGMTLKQPAFRLIELGAATVLHEIGMVKLPPQVYMAGRALTPVEKKTITAHPVLGYNILKERQVPLAVCLAVLEHHERMNGAGYPRAIGGDKISLYARIIMVACSYDAVTSNRPHKEAKDGYAGMVDILKNEGKQYDDNVIRALVYSLSIFPIGSRVLLTNGKPALVIDISPDNPRYPVVQVLGHRTPDGKDIVIKTSETGVRVLRPLSKEEQGKIAAAIA